MFAQALFRRGSVKLFFGLVKQGEDCFVGDAEGNVLGKLFVDLSGGQPAAFRFQQCSFVGAKRVDALFVRRLKRFGSGGNGLNGSFDFRVCAHTGTPGIRKLIALESPNLLVSEFPDHCLSAAAARRALHRRWFVVPAVLRASVLAPKH